MKKLLLYSMMALAIATLYSCEKPEGRGGKATIRGKVYVINYNGSFTQINDEYYAQDESVYIVYGDDATYGDRTRTNYDGIFEFDYLREGNYKVYVYSKDKDGNSPSGELAMITEVEIIEKKQVIELEDIVIFR
ncbi:MAG: hypothetical protein COA57_06175 [Flavobacteriales bacterium]|nr:MAG: hypothetical protein COA57_06175 [Flavobacteriales bacterium]